MKYIIIILTLLCISSCHSNNIYSIGLESKEIERIKNELMRIEYLESKIEGLDTKESNQIIYGTDKISISILNSSINFNEIDSIVENRKNPNPQIINDLVKLPGLSDSTTIELKNLISNLCIDYNLCYQSYIKYNPENSEGIYIYEYINNEDMLENPEQIGYLAIVNKKDAQNKYFQNRFIVEDQKQGLFLLRKKW